MGYELGEGQLKSRQDCCMGCELGKEESMSREECSMGSRSSEKKSGSLMRGQCWLAGCGVDGVKGGCPRHSRPAGIEAREWPRLRSPLPPEPGGQHTLALSRQPLRQLHVPLLREPVQVRRARRPAEMLPVTSALSEQDHQQCMD